MPYLKKVSGEPTGQCIELKADSLSIGRAPECDIILDPHGVSRRHACIRREGADYFLCDLRSRNKTKVNDGEVIPGHDHLLRQGDKINICDVEFVYYVKHPSLTLSASSAAAAAIGDGRDAAELIVTEEKSDESTIHTLDASRVDLTLQAGADPKAKLRAILEITRSLSRSLEIDAVAPKVLDSLFELFPQAERAFLVLRDPETRRLIRKAFKHRPPKPGRPGSLGGRYDDEAPMKISRSIVDHVLERKQAVLSQDAGNLPTSASIADLKIQSVMCAPLLTPDGQALGILQLDTGDRKQFHQDDLDLLLAVASQSAIAIQNAAMHENMLAQERVSRDLRLAEQVQKRFLPAAVPTAPGYRFFAHYHAAYEVGGDYYDFVGLGGDRVAIALGDVSGKGVAAALMMAKFSGDTRACILTENAPAPAADQLNRLLCAAGIEEKFITMSLGVLDFAGHELTLCSAGHLPVIIRKASGQVVEIGEEIAGFPLGIMPDSEYRQMTVALGVGDVVVVYSDGVTDARNGAEELYDSKANRRLLKRVAESVGGPEAVGKAILQEIREFSAGYRQADDITLICYGRHEG